MAPTLGVTLLTLFPLLHLIPTTTADCTTFTPIQLPGLSNDTYTQPSLTTFPVSESFSCPRVSNCSLWVAGYITDHRTLNITTPSLSALTSFFAAAALAVNHSFNASITGNISTTHFFFPNGTRGHVGFTPYHLCTQGLLSDCDGADGDVVANDTAVELCTPYVFSLNGTDSLGYPSLAGTLSAVQSDADDDLTCVIANTTVGRVDGLNFFNCTTASDAEASYEAEVSAGVREVRGGGVGGLGVGSLGCAGWCWGIVDLKIVIFCTC